MIRIHSKGEIKSRSLKSRPKPKIKLKLGQLFHDDMAFMIEDLVEAVLAIFLVICLSGILIPMALEMYGGIPETWTGGGFEILWYSLPALFLIAFVVGGVIAIIRYFRGTGGGGGDIIGRV